MITPEIPITGARPTTAPPSAPAQASSHGLSFHDVLSAMNPLQYLPAVGTLYRAVTGDVVAEPVRDIGSLLVSGLLGGPIGVVTSIATTIAEKITGIDPEKIIAAQLKPSHAEAAAATAGAAKRAVAPETNSALTPQQMSAYGISSDASGDLKLGDMHGAEVLNFVQLTRLQQATAAYAANQGAPNGARAARSASLA